MEKIYTKKNILIISETDECNDGTFKGERYDMVFIHKNNKNIDKYKERAMSCVSIFGVYLGQIYTYD